MLVQDWESPTTSAIQLQLLPATQKHLHPAIYDIDWNQKTGKERKQERKKERKTDSRKVWKNKEMSDDKKEKKLEKEMFILFPYFYLIHLVI